MVDIEIEDRSYIYNRQVHVYIHTHVNIYTHRERYIDDRCKNRYIEQGMVAHN